MTGNRQTPVNLYMFYLKILDKLNTDGWDGLTEDEQKVLHKASKTYSENRPPN